MTKYYVDSCIWLNLLNKEQNKIQGLPVWKITEMFLMQNPEKIILTRFVRKEVLHKIKEKDKILLLDHFQELTANDKEIFLARTIESKEKYALSFFDCIHLALCHKRDYILLTRDKELF